MKHTLWQLILSITLAFQSFAAEIYFETTNMPVGSAPAGFTPWVIGSGPSGDWKVRMDSLPSAMVQISPLAVQSNRKKVISQHSAAKNTNRILMLTKDKEVFEDFEMTTRVKTGQDQQTQALGIVFRWQDPKNYYSFCVDTIAGMYYFRKVVNGRQQEPLGNRIKIASNEWHSLRIECKGPRISLTLNQKEAIPEINDTQFKSGRIGYWSAADTVASFGDTKIIFTPKIAIAQRLVDQVMAKYSRLIQVSVYASATDSTPPTLIAGNLKNTIGSAADKSVLDTIARSKFYFEKTKKTAIVTLPIKDRNGESIAACRVELKKFKGQTESNAIVRAMPVVEMIQARILDRRDLFE